MKKITVRKMALVGIMAAMVYVTSAYIQIPIPTAIGNTGSPGSEGQHQAGSSNNGQQNFVNQILIVHRIFLPCFFYPHYSTNWL